MRMTNIDSYNALFSLVKLMVRVCMPGFISAQPLSGIIGVGLGIRVCKGVGEEMVSGNSS